MDSLLEPLAGARPCQHFDFGLLACKTVQVSVVLNQQICGNLLQSPYELRNSLMRTLIFLENNRSTWNPVNKNSSQHIFVSKTPKCHLRKSRGTKMLILLERYVQKYFNMYLRPMVLVQLDLEFVNTVSEILYSSCRPP